MFATSPFLASSFRRKKKKRDSQFHSHREFSRDQEEGGGEGIICRSNYAMKIICAIRFARLLSENEIPGLHLTIPLPPRSYNRFGFVEAIGRGKHATRRSLRRFSITTQ